MNNQEFREHKKLQQQLADANKRIAELVWALVWALDNAVYPRFMTQENLERYEGIIQSELPPKESEQPGV